MHLGIGPRQFSDGSLLVEKEAISGEEGEGSETDPSPRWAGCIEENISGKPCAERREMCLRR
jgi:hypothetical protein